MKAFFGNITPDSFSGAIFAVEGILDACTVLNGPTGCKFYHSAIAGSQFQRFEGDPLSPLSEFHFGMPRIPTTYLDGNDYVFSGREKLERLLRMAAGGGYGLIAVINSPGAALIGDDLTGFLKRTVRGTPCFTVEAAGFSDSFGAGYQRALAGAIDALRGPAGRCPERRARTVNLLGLGIYQRYHEGDRHALERLLRLCGVDVLSVPGAGDKAASLARLGQAALNVVVYPEYGMDLAEKLRADYGTPALVAEEGPPLGFDGTESFLRQVSAALDMDPAPALDCIEKAQARAYGFLARFTTLLGFPKGALFSLKAEPSTAYALTRWLSSYLGMIPQAISLNDEGYSPFAPRLKTYLDSINRGGALTSPLIKSPCHLFFGDANTIAALRLEGQRFCGIEIAMPSISYVDVTEKSLLGEQGALFLLEQVLNGLRYVLT